MSALALAGAALGGAVAVGWPLGRMWWRAEQESRMWWRCLNMVNRWSKIGGATFLLDGTEPVLVVWPAGKMPLSSTNMLKMGATAYGLPADQLVHAIDAHGRDVVRPKPGIKHRFKIPEAGERY